MRIPAYLTDHEVPFESLWHAPAYTATKLAKHLRMRGRQVVKTVLLQMSGEFLVALLPSTMHVDLESISREFGRPVFLAKENEIAEIFGDCEYGSLAPFGRLYGLATIRDDSIDPQSDIILEVHGHCYAIRMRCADFDRMEQPKRFCFSRPIHDVRRTA